MGRDNQPKERQKARDLHRKAAKRQPFERLLIVDPDHDFGVPDGKYYHYGRPK